MAHNGRHTAFKVLGVILLIVVLLIGGSFLWLNMPRHKVVTYRATSGSTASASASKTVVKTEPNYVAILKEQLPKFLSRKTQSKYKMSIGDIRVSIADNEITAANVRIWADTAAARSKGAAGKLWQATLPSVKISGVNWLALVTDKELRADELVAMQPKISVTDLGEADEKGAVRKDLTGDLNKLTVQRVSIQDPQIVYNMVKDGARSSFTLSKGNIVLSKWTIGENSGSEPGSFFYAGSGTVKLRSMSYSKPGTRYKVTSSGVSFSTAGNNLKLTNLRIVPLLKKDAHDQKQGVQKEMYTIVLPSAEFRGLDVRQLTGKNTLHASSLMLQGPSIDVYLSRLPPPSRQSRVERYPHQLLRGMDMRINIPTVSVAGARVKYTELNRKTSKAGVITFTNINGTVRNVSNERSALATNNKCTAHFTAVFEGKSPITTDWSLDLADPGGAFTMKGSLSDLDAAQIDDDTKALSMLSIPSLHVKRMDLTVHGSASHSSGNFTMLYNGLKVEMLELNEDGRLDDKDASSWLVNHVYTFPDNPMPGDVVRTATTNVPQDRMRSFLGLVFANLKEGINKTVIKDPQLAELHSEKVQGTARRKAVLKAFFRSAFRRKSQ